jgi:hypothetical protein
MKERTGLIMMKGNPLTLVGNEVKVGDKALDFTALDNALSRFKFYPTEVKSVSSPLSHRSILRFAIWRQGDSMKRLVAWAQIF